MNQSSNLIINSNSDDNENIESDVDVYVDNYIYIQNILYDQYIIDEIKSGRYMILKDLFENKTNVKESEYGTMIIHDLGNFVYEVKNGKIKDRLDNIDKDTADILADLEK